MHVNISFMHACMCVCVCVGVYIIHKYLCYTQIKHKAWHTRAAVATRTSTAAGTLTHGQEPRAILSPPPQLVRVIECITSPDSFPNVCPGDRDHVTSEPPFRTSRMPYTEFFALPLLNHQQLSSCWSYAPKASTLARLPEHGRGHLDKGRVASRAPHSI